MELTEVILKRKPGRAFQDYCKYGHRLSETRRKNPNGRTYCYPCRKRAKAEYRERKREIIRKKWRESTWNKFGLTEERYDELLIQQDRRCEICNTQVKARLDVDHCHVTNRFRGLLCHYCNKGLGLFKDNVEFLARAREYLIRSIERVD